MTPDNLLLVEIIIAGGFNGNSATVSFGLQAGVSISNVSTKVEHSVSLTSEEAKRVSSLTDVWTESWFVKNLTPIYDSNGIITHYTGTVSTMNTKGNLIDTQIPVKSGVKVDKNGNMSTNNIWISHEYQKLLDNKQNGNKN